MSKMKSAEEWIRDFVEVFLIPTDIEAVQRDARISAFEEAAAECLTYAGIMHGAHVNTNDSSSAIRKAILTLATKEESL